jgi:hypothetical protein
LTVATAPPPAVAFGFAARWPEALPPAGDWVAGTGTVGAADALGVACGTGTARGSAGAGWMALGGAGGAAGSTGAGWAGVGTAGVGGAGVGWLGVGWVGDGVTGVGVTGEGVSSHWKVAVDAAPCTLLSPVNVTVIRYVRLDGPAGAHPVGTPGASGCPPASPVSGPV